MTPVAQTILGTSKEGAVPGNCLQAAIASMLDLLLDDVPHFVAEDVAGGEHWWTHLRQFVHERGLSIRHAEPQPGEYYIGRGPSPRHVDQHHVAVYRDGELVHDPHPSGVGLAEVATRWVIRPTSEGGPQST